MASLGDIERATLSANSDISSQTDRTVDALKNLDVTNGMSIDASVESFDLGGAILSGLTFGIFGNGGIIEYDFVGIADQNGVTEMKNAITKYCNSVKDAMAAFAQTADPGDTFRGSYAEEIKSFVLAIKNSCDATVDSLTKFNKDLDSVYAAMEAKARSVASNISDDTSSIRSATNIESN